jgi:Domain of unknown function (DUF383)/Domain of unknown function (DUF384)
MRFNTEFQNSTEPNANLIAMLLANLSKNDSLERLLTLSRPAPASLSSTLAISQLLDLFVRGVDGQYNKDANFDYLSYLFAGLAKHASGRTYFVTAQAYDSVIPLTKLTVFTEHSSPVRRCGVASTIKNVAFDVPAHEAFLATDAINALPYILLPIMGGEEYDEEDAMAMLPDLQLLPPDKRRETEPAVVQTHVETLMLLTTTRYGRDLMRRVRVYPIIREAHLAINHDGVREACERLVQVLMRDEEGESVAGGMQALQREVSVSGSGSSAGRTREEVHLRPAGGAGSWAKVENEVEDSDGEDEDDQIIEV